MSVKPAKYDGGLGARSSLGRLASAGPGRDGDDVGERNGSSSRAGSLTPKRSLSVNGKESNGHGAKVLSVLGVIASEPPVGKRTPRKPSSKYDNSERAAEVLVSLSPQINLAAARAAQSPGRNYARDSIAQLANGGNATPKRKRARALFPDETLPPISNGSSPARKPKVTADEDVLFGALDGLMTLADVTDAETPKKKRKPGSGRPRGSYSSPARQLPPMQRYTLRPPQMPVGKKMLKMNRPRRHLSREIESNGLGAASSLFGDHRLNETPSPAAEGTMANDNRARLLIGTHNPLTRRWANANFFTAGTDKAWFADSGFVRWLQSIGKGNTRVATRADWKAIRRTLPKTRRLSNKFLSDERIDLEYCRHAAREMTELKLSGKPLTPELQAKLDAWTCGVDVSIPLEVGQNVLAVHPRFNSPYIGSILTVDRSTCRVQFARPELGVELVRDIDIMPIEVTPEEADLIARETAEQIENEAFTAGFRGSYDPVPVLGGGQAYSSGVAAAAQMREIDVRLLTEAQQALERKRELVNALASKNDAAEEFKKKPERVRQAAKLNGEALKFQREYAAIVLRLRDSNTELEACLLRLRQQQGYNDKPLALWRKIKSQSLGADGQRALSRFAPAATAPSSEEMYAATAEDIVATAGMGARRIVYHVQNTTTAGAESTATLNPSLQEPLVAGDAMSANAPAVDGENDPDKVKVTQLITAIIQATLTIKACADHGASASVLNACIDRVSDSLRPIAVSNRGAFGELSSALRALRDVLLIRA